MAGSSPGKDRFFSDLSSGRALPWFDPATGQWSLIGGSRTSPEVFDPASITAAMASLYLSIPPLSLTDEQMRGIMSRPDVQLSYSATAATPILVPWP